MKGNEEYNNRKRSYYSDIVSETENRDVQELLKQIPGWGTRWGLLAVSIVLFALTPFFCIVKIPVNIKGEVRLVQKSVYCEMKTNNLLVEATFKEEYYSELVNLKRIKYQLTGFPKKKYESFVSLIQCVKMGESKGEIKLIGTIAQESLPADEKLLEGMSGEAEVSLRKVTLANSFTDLWLKQ